MVTPLPLLPPALDRRTFVRGGLAGVGLLALPGAALGAIAKGFTHGVASGEPGADRVLLWTRFAGSGEGAALRYEVAESLDFAKPISGGEVRARADRDWCAKAVASGLQPGRWYYYRFVGPAGETSPVGRTRTSTCREPSPTTKPAMSVSAPAPARPRTERLLLGNRIFRRMGHEEV